jgi:hypothetical protein
LSAARASSTFSSDMVYAVSPAGGEGCKRLSAISQTAEPPIGRLRGAVKGCVWGPEAPQKKERPPSRKRPLL